eukprot:INCI15354.2.p1 GENE.INCI15354.2~~INCI15354.2.p1  ORF type:complete len:1007 (-),score=157.08 INCI15354.2:416-3436(-)
MTTMESGNMTTNNLTLQFLDICEYGATNGFNEGYFAPIFTPEEWGWPPALRAIVYFVGMLWSFLGVSIIADIFMGSIETVTSSFRKVTIEKRNGKSKIFYVRVWNDTVANLTLMALGSSAPEILLSVIEIVGAGFYAGPLGPSTIVGSAAFNLFVIIGVCVFSVAAAGTTIKDLPVFYVTAVFSIFAYLWMVVILYAVTPQVIEVWEGVATFLLFFVLVIMAYFMDVRHKICRPTKKTTSKVAPHKPNQTLSADNRGEKPAWHRQSIDGGPGRVRQISLTQHSMSEAVTQDEVYAIVKGLRQDHPKIKQADLLRKAAVEAGQLRRNSRAFHRVNASRMMAGGNTLCTIEDVLSAQDEAKKKKSLNKGHTALLNKKISMRAADGVSRTESANPTSRMSVQFEHDLYSAHDSAETITVKASRHSLPGAQLDLSQPLSLILQTEDPDDRDDVDPDDTSWKAMPNRDYMPLTSKLVTIPIDETDVDIVVSLNNQAPTVEFKEFKVVLSLANPLQDAPLYSKPSAETTIRVYDDHAPGLLQFHYKTATEQSKQAFIVCESEKRVLVSVRRHNGALGTLRCKYKTRDGSAVSSDDRSVADYMEVEGELEFGPGEVSKDIEIEIIDDDQYERDENFFVELFDVTFEAEIAELERLGSGKGGAVAPLEKREPVLDEKTSPNTESKKKSKKSSKIKKVSSKKFSGSIGSSAPPGAPKNWTGFDPLNDGSPQETLSTEVVIISDEAQRLMTDQIVGMLMINRDRLAVGNSNYKMQFLNALYPGGYDSYTNKEHLKKPGCAQCIMWFMHLFTLPWKVLFAIVPPSDFCGGYLAFLIALAFIAVLTMLISDLSSMFGCIIGFDPAFTAITFVALGTSLPDLFASRSAAMHDRHADASIGNITGSNSVNVFLGLGLPWFIASIYWNTVTDPEIVAEWKGRFISPSSPQFDPVVADYFFAHGGSQPTFVVKAGNLVFSVVVFCSGALICLVSVELRRCINCCGNVELGGPTAAKWTSGTF